MLRPYGSTILMSTYDKSNGPALHVIDPSGTSFRYYGAAVGKGRQLARNEIEKLKLTEMTCRYGFGKCGASRLVVPLCGQDYRYDVISFNEMFAPA